MKKSIVLLPLLLLLIHACLPTKQEANQVNKAKVTPMYKYNVKVFLEG